jgi:hypothetical protein
VVYGNNDYRGGGNGEWTTPGGATAILLFIGMLGINLVAIILSIIILKRFFSIFIFCILSSISFIILLWFMETQLFFIVCFTLSILFVITIFAIERTEALRRKPPPA